MRIFHRRVLCFCRPIGLLYSHVMYSVGQLEYCIVVLCYVGQLGYCIVMVYNSVGQPEYCIVGLCACFGPLRTSNDYIILWFICTRTSNDYTINDVFLIYHHAGKYCTFRRSIILVCSLIIQACFFCIHKSSTLYSHIISLSWVMLCDCCLRERPLAGVLRAPMESMDLVRVR